MDELGLLSGVDGGHKMVHRRPEGEAKGTIGIEAFIGPEAAEQR